MNSEAKYYQHIEVHLKNGEKVDVYEDYNLPVEKGIVGEFKRGRKKYLEAKGSLCSLVIPYEQVSYIALTDVKRTV